MAELPQAFGGYVLLKMLGSGVSGDVFLAKPKEPRAGIPSPVVIKRLHPELSEDRAFAMRFKQEAQIAIAVDSAHVAKVYDVGKVGPTYYMAIEYIAGWTLSRVISDLREAGAFASISSVRDTIGDALEGLGALHRATDPQTGAKLDVVHRDLAPKNIILGEDSVTRLIDLGIGKSNYQDWRTGTGVVVGSPGYMSPEQARGGEVDQRSDIYGMGLVMWELLTSRSFIDRGPIPVMLRQQAEPQYRPPSSVRPELSKAIDDVVRTALARDPAERYQTAAEMQAALYSVLGARSARLNSSTIVGALLWGELGSAKTEITELLASAVFEELPSEASASESGSDDTLVLARVSALTDAAIEAEPVEPMEPLPQLVFVSVPPVRRGLPMSWVAGLMMLALAVGILIAVQYWASRRNAAHSAAQTAPPAQHKKVEETAIARPSIESRAPKKEVSPPPLPAIEEEAAVPVNAPRRRRERTDRTDRTDRAKVTPRPRPPAVQELNINALIERARALQQRFGLSTANGKAAARIASDLNLEAARAELDLAAVAALEEKLRRLERK